MTAPDQILRGRGLQALGLAHRHLNGNRRARVQPGPRGTRVAAEGTTTVAIRATSGRTTALRELGTTGTERGTPFLRTAAEGPAAVTAACVGATAIARTALGTTIRASARTSPAGSVAAEAIAAATVAEALRTTAVARAAETGSFRTGALEAGSIKATVLAVLALGATFALRAIGAPLTAGLEGPRRTEGTTRAGTGALPLVPATIKTGAHGRQADGLWDGVLESIQQLGKTAGVPQKEPANHCLKSRGPAIDARFTAAGSPAGPVAPLPYLL